MRMDGLRIENFYKRQDGKKSARCRDHKAPHCVVFSIPLLHRPFYAQILSSAPSYQTLSSYVPPSM